MDGNRIYDDLIAAKCSQGLASECRRLAAMGAAASMLPQLSAERDNLLAQLREYQEAIDRIDVITHEIRKGK